MKAPVRWWRLKKAEAHKAKADDFFEKAKKEERYAIMGERGAESLDEAGRNAGRKEAATHMENLAVAREMENRFKEIEGSDEHSNHPK